MIPRPKKLYIFRGLPGSGKSAAARKIGCLVIEPQDQWATRDGIYQWVPEEAAEATNNSLDLVRSAMWLGYDIAVAEVLPKCLDVQKYIDLAFEFQYTFSVTDIGISIKDAVRRNTHGVPEDTLKKMLTQWEPWVT